MADEATASESYEIRLSNADFHVDRLINIDVLKYNICHSPNLCEHILMMSTMLTAFACCLKVLTSYFPPKVPTSTFRWECMLMA